MTDPCLQYPWLKDLNPEQLQAVTHGAGHLLVIAGAGSGKTRTLAYRVAYLIATGTDPGRILLLTFTRRAAEEMLKRAAAVVERGARVSGRVWGGTFHAMANRLLRIHAEAAGLNRDFTVLDQSDAEDLLDVLRHELRLQSRETRFPGKATCLAIYSRCVNGAADLPAVLERYFPWCAGWKGELKALFQAYVRRKQGSNVLDYDDLLLYWAQLVADADLARRIGGRFDHILVDEYQDTNGLQAAILRGMAQGGARITAVGDDAQSIYSFRAATVRNMLDFPRHFPGAATVTLSQNYRSVMPILQTTNRLIAQARERYTKDLWSARAEGQPPRLVTCRDEAEQDAYIVRRVLEHREQGIALRRQAVLFRAAHLSDTLELELTRRRIPYHKYGGLRFLEAAHVKDLIAFLRLLENPRDEMAWFRALQLFECVGPATAGRALAHVAQHGHDPRALASFAAPPAARAGFAALAAAIEELSRFGAHQPAAQVERLRVFYEPLLARRYENPAARARDLEHLEQIASGYRTRRRFLTDLHLDPPASTSDLAGPPLRDEDWLVLSTIHSAKGGEWDVVYLIHAADGCLPSDMAAGSAEELEEELRLTYVALTRARDFLYVTWPLRYYHRHVRFTDRHSYAQLCRFFTPEVRAGMTAERAATEEEPDAAEAPARGGPDIAARVRARWD